MAVSCKAPQATIIETPVKKELPPAFKESENTASNSGLIPWREFFTDPQLEHLIEVALHNNQDLMMTLQKIEIAKNDILYKNGRLSPTVSATLGSGIKKAARYTSEGAGDASTEMEPGVKIPDYLGNFGGGLVTDWEVDIWHKLRTEKQSAVAHYLATVEGKNFVLSNLISEVANSYYELMALDNKLDLIHQYMEVQKKALEVSKIQKEAAAATELAVKKFEAELAKSRAEEYTLKQEITEKENEINTLLGRYPQPIERDKDAFMTTMPQSVATGVPSELLLNRPDVKQAEYELQSAKLDVEAARKEFYPSLNISATLGLEAFNPKYLAKIPESVGLSLLGELSGPLINKSAIQANFKNADAQQISALYEYDKTLIEAYSSVSSLLSKMKNMELYCKLKKNQSDALEEAIQISILLFKNSRADYLEVLLNQRDALDAKMELIEAKQTQLGTVVDLYKNLGGGWK